MGDSAIIAISGGIDSLYSAHLLLEKGYRVEGVHFITGYEYYPDQSVPLTDNAHIIKHCKCRPETETYMAAVANQLGIKIHIIDCSKIFRKNVIDYFISEYQRGRTPNPCLLCNPTVKFGILNEFAKSIGADRLATGHYAKTSIDSRGNSHLYKGDDPKKDQSYFLSFLSQEQLKTALFPLGGLTKEEISIKAAKKGLLPVTKAESQDICFIHNNDYKAFLSSQKAFRADPGSILTEDGKEIGAHNGLHSYTIGQRRGINCPGPFPYYVTRIDINSNSLIVGPRESLFSNFCRITGINWINRPENSEVLLTTRIRYAHKGVKALVKIIDDSTAEVEFEEPVSAVTPGQGAVFFKETEVLGGGWIK